MTDNDIEIILRYFDIKRQSECNLIDSSRGEDDVRFNYIIDKKYVLRINSADVMSEKRIEELNRLILRYNKFGLIAPLFLKTAQGNYIVKHKNFFCYVSEYADYATADNSENIDENLLCDEILLSIAKFAQTYKNVDLSSSMSMYSIFELSPYDIAAGIDEKQENLNNLIDTLKQIGETEIAQTLDEHNREIRSNLIGFYDKLPRCVFQGDENFTNVLVDDCGHFIGLIDFNLSGTEVVANYFANAIGASFEEQDVKNLTAQQMVDKAVCDFTKRFEMVARFYDFTQDEKRALNLYGKIVLLSSYPNERFFSFCLNSDVYKQKTLEFLRLIPEVQLLNF